MDPIQRLKADYPWIQTPLVVGAPMRLIALADLAVEITNAGGIGFIGAGTDVSDLSTYLSDAKKLLQDSPSAISTAKNTLPVGVGFINWGASLPDSIPLVGQYKPAAVWFFAPSSLDSLAEWARESRKVSPGTKIWVQVGSVKQATEALAVEPDVLVVQGSDAGGHGLVQGAGIVSLVPEVHDAVQELCSKNKKQTPVLIAAGGIADARGAAAALVLGASGVVMGTRFLAAKEARIAKGYQNEVLRVTDGGQTTVRTKVYDNLRGTTGWADTHNARGVINKSFVDAVAGMAHEENKKLYQEEEKKGDAGWGVDARMTTYAGAGIGLVKTVLPAGEIVREVREGAKRVLEKVKL